ncbi:hypothetical protein A2U01_0114940, partial [Trifolium medium]|nr:hypothetical protein [Trifolium medium]
QRTAPGRFTNPSLQGRCSEPCSEQLQGVPEILRYMVVAASRSECF